MVKSSIIFAPISVGELFDKLTILEIKRDKLKGLQLKNIKKEITYLEEVFKKNNLLVDKKIFSKLKNINKNLWNIEDQIRIKESKSEFDNDFINLARSVYFENDKRASLKKEINIKYNSELIEEKSYK